MRKCIAECIGTFTLVFVGCGAIVVDAANNGIIGHLGISVAFGMAVMTMIYAIGNVSGAHLNPAVTLGFVMAKRIELKEAGGYIVSQLIGALIASFLLCVVVDGPHSVGATMPAGSLFHAFVLEVVLTFLLMFVILNVATGHYEKGIMAGVAVGSTVAMAAMIGGPISGASLNPARSIGPAIASGEFSHLWLYIVAPVLGALLAAPSCRLIQGEKCCVPGSEEKGDGI